MQEKVSQSTCPLSHEKCNTKSTSSDKYASRLKCANSEKIEPAQNPHAQKDVISEKCDKN